MRVILDELERVFEEIEQRLVCVVESADFQSLREVNPDTGTSSAELLIRSAANIEQCFGGLTTRLWDDPFEWTLPEELNTREAVLEYLNEAKETRIRGFRFLVSDTDLTKKIVGLRKTGYGFFGSDQCV